MTLLGYSSSQFTHSQFEMAFSGMEIMKGLVWFGCAQQCMYIPNVHIAGRPASSFTFFAWCSNVCLWNHKMIMTQETSWFGKSPWWHTEKTVFVVFYIIGKKVPLFLHLLRSPRKWFTDIYGGHLDNKNAAVILIAVMFMYLYDH